MSDLPNVKTTQALITAVQANGGEPGEIRELGISTLSNPGMSFWAFADTPRETFLRFLQVAHEALWAGRKVEIDWTQSDGGDALIADIRAI